MTNIALLIFSSMTNILGRSQPVLQTEELVYIINTTVSVFFSHPLSGILLPTHRHKYKF